MIVRKLKDSDLPEIKVWLLKHNLSRDLADQYGSLKLLVLHEGLRIAAGSVRSMENCKVGYVDGYITNPYACSEDRDEALNMLTLELINEAHQKGFECLMFKSTEPNILTRAENYGFQKLPHVMMARKLGVEL